MQYDKVLPMVSIVVIVRNNKEEIQRCLESLMFLDYPKDKFEIIVVDGGSTDGTFEICQKFAVKTIVEKKKGRGLARNVGIKSARGEIMAFVDSDCEVFPSWLKIHVKDHSLNIIGGVGGAVISNQLDSMNKLGRIVHNEDFAEFTENTKRGYKYYIPTCNASFKMHVLSKVGFFDEELDAYEDFVISKKIQDQGFKILFDPAPKVLHYNVAYEQESKKALIAYMEREKQLGKTHFLAQVSERSITGRLPMQPLAIIFLTPSVVLARILRQLAKIIESKNSAKLTLKCIPHIVLGGILWGFSYGGKAFSYSLKKGKIRSI